MCNFRKYLILRTVNSLYSEICIFINLVSFCNNIRFSHFNLRDLTSFYFRKFKIFASSFFIRLKSCDRPSKTFKDGNFQEIKKNISIVVSFPKRTALNTITLILEKSRKYIANVILLFKRSYDLLNR